MSHFRNIKPFFFFLLPVIFLAFCSNPMGKKRTTIQGSFPKFSGKQVVFSKINISDVTPLDTATLTDKGEFRFRLDHDSAGLYLVKLDNRNYLTLVLDQEKKVSISSGADQIRGNYTVEGSVESQNLAAFEKELEKNKSIVDSLILQYNQGGGAMGMTSVQIRMDQQYQDAFNAQKEVSKKFIEDNCGSLASLLVLNRRFGQLRILTEEEDSRYFIMVDSCLSEKYPGNEHLAEHKKRLESILRQKAIHEHREKKLAVGKKVPDITLEDPDGTSISLYSLRGKPVIVYFWASWDKDSRVANKEMKRIYEMFRPSGLKVYAIALESYREVWSGAIRADGLDWINVTDYLNIQSGSLGLFNVPDKLPYFFLLDEELAIRYKGSNFVDLLDELRK